MTTQLGGAKAFISSSMAHHGAVLVRRTGYQTPDQFLELLDALRFQSSSYPYFTDNYRLPRNRGVVNASSTTANLPVPPHTEQAFNRFRPGVVAFMCIRPAERGGQTPLHDCVAAFSELPETIQNQLLECSFCKVTTGISERGLVSNFNTTDKATINSICERFGVVWSWHGNSLSFTTKGPCVTKHPTTGEIALSAFWTIASLHFFFKHYSSIPGSDPVLGRLCRAMPLRLFDFMARHFHPFFRTDYRFFFEGRGGQTAISLNAQREINRVLWKNTVIFQWLSEDVLLIDNIRMGHSRFPFVPPREVVASVCDYYDATSPDCLPSRPNTEGRMGLNLFSAESIIYAKSSWSRRLR
jgi:alpha-ketoglutarate-dependent taurine dioxygenase